MPKTEKMSLFIVDDELYIVEMLKALIDWDGLALVCAGVAYDGILAHERISALQPDIAIVDIHLPGLNGLELIKRLTAENSPTKFIVVSGYGQFQYAQTAMQYGVREYILKPIQQADLDASLRRTRALLEQVADTSTRQTQMYSQYRDVLRDNFLSAVLEGSSFSDSLEKINDQYKLSLAEGLFQVLLLGVDCDFGQSVSQDAYSEMISYVYNELRTDLLEPLSPYCFDVLLKVLPTRAVAFLNFIPANTSILADTLRNKLKFILLSCDRFEGVRIVLAKGRPVSSLNDLPLSVSSADIAFMQRILPDTESIIDAKDYAPDWKYDIALKSTDLHLIQSAVKNGNEDALRGCFETLISVYSISNITDARSYWELAMLFFSISTNILIQACDPIMPIKYSEREAALRKILSQCNDCEQFKKKLVDFLVMQVLNCRGLEKSARNNILFVIDQYIADHYRDKIQLRDIAEVAHLNPVYLSIYFKKLKGINLIDYINEFRIDKAKERLRNTTDPIYNIAEDTGFANAKYFAKVFRHFVGISPSDYRKGTIDKR